MKINRYTYFKELLPDEGKVLTDGNGYSTAVAMPLDGDETIWQEIDKIEEEEENEL